MERSGVPTRIGEVRLVCVFAAITTHNVPLDRRYRSIQRIELTDHGRHQFCDSRMNVHGALNHREESKGQI